MSQSSEPRILIKVQSRTLHHGLAYSVLSLMCNLSSPASFSGSLNEEVKRFFFSGANVRVVEVCYFVINMCVI